MLFCSLIFSLFIFKVESFRPYKEDLKFIKKFSFIHFNDVYNIESRVQAPVGGASSA
jgi:hypothetical protein